MTRKEFKVGDKVEAKPGYENQYSIKSKTVMIREITDGGNCFQTDDSYFKKVNYPLCCFQLVEKAPDPIEKAKALLEKNGYTVTDPPKPRTRRVVAYTFNNTNSIHFAEEDYFKRNESTFYNPIIIEVFDWTEGMGKQPS